MDPEDSAVLVDKVSEKNASKLQKILAVLQHKDRLSKTNQFLISSGDMNLSMVGYPSLLLSAIIRYLGETPSVKRILVNAVRNLPDSSLLKKRISDPTRLANRLKTLYGLTSDLRTFIRMWASLDYVEWAVASLKNPSQDWVLRYVDYAQLFACIWYQILENIAYLGSHGVLSMNTATENRLWSVSCICWAVHVQLDFIKMFRTRYLKEGKVDFKWWNGLAVNCCYVPLSIHWSLEKGCLPDFIVGLFGTFTTYSSAIPKWSTLLEV